MKITVLVKPNSRHEGVTPQPDGSLLVRVNARPVEGQANERLIHVLADHLHLPPSRLRICVGARGKRKVVEIV